MAHHRAFTYFIALHPGELYNSGEAAAKRKTNEFCWLLKPHGTELALRPLPLPSPPNAAASKRHIHTAATARPHYDAGALRIHE